MSDLFAFRNAFHAAGLSINLRVRYNNFTPPQTPWQNVQAPPGKFLLAVMLEASVAFTATGAGSTVVSSTDLLDEWLQSYEVSPTSGGGTDRIQTKTRVGCEEVERLVLDTSLGYTNSGWNSATSHIGSYPRAAATAFTTAGTRTDTSELWIPIGGPAASIRLNMAPLSAVWTTPANVSAVYSIGFFEVYSLYSGICAAYENKTATLASGNYQDLIAERVIPSSLAVDIVDFVQQTTTNVTQLMVTDQSGLPIIKCDDAQSINASQYIYPQFAQTIPSYNSLVFFLNKTVPTTFQVSLANSVALDLLFIQVQGPTDVPANPPATTPGTPAVSQIGTQLPGVGPTPNTPISPSGSGSGSATPGPSGPGTTAGKKFAGYPGR